MKVTLNRTKHSLLISQLAVYDYGNNPKQLSRKPTLLKLALENTTHGKASESAV